MIKSHESYSLTFLANMKLFIIDLPYPDAGWLILAGVKWPFFGENNHFIAFLSGYFYCL